MEIKKSLYNSVFGILSMIILGIVSFFKISIIVNILGNQYNGLNNLYSQIFNFLMIGEAGIGIATTSLLYKHIINNDIEAINEIISGSRKVLTVIINMILIIILVISFGIPYLIKENTLNQEMIILSFIIFSIKAITPQYLQPFKGYIAAKQDEYILKIYQIILNTLVGLIEIILLYMYRNFIVMLLSGAVITILLEYLMYIFLKNKYNRINFFYSKKNLEVKNHIKELIKVNIVGTVSKSIDPIIISKILGLVMTSLYSNYNYVLNFLLTILGVGIGGFTHYFGNIFAKKNKNMKNEFDNFIVITNILATFFSIMFFLLIKDFIILWINSKDILPLETSLLFSILIYIYTIMKPMNIFIVTNKYFELASRTAIYETFINLLISLFFINRIGLNGVLLGTIISFMGVSFWYFPIKTYKTFFSCSSKDYFFKQIKSIIILILMFYFFHNISKIFNFSISWKYFIIKGIILSIFCSSIIIICYFISFREVRKILELLKKYIDRKKCYK